MSKTWYSGGQGLVIDEADGHTVAVAYDEKDAPLLAAAPELAEALWECADMLEEAHAYEADNGHGGDERTCSYCAALDAARAALEKAGVVEH